MANELTLSATLAYEDSEGDEDVLSVLSLAVTLATKKYSRAKVAVGTSEEALPLGEVTDPGWCLIINRDATNFVNLKTGTGGTIFAKLKPGEFAFLRLGSGAQVPFAIADTATCQVTVLVFAT